MDLNLLKQHGPGAWEIPAQGKMRVPGHDLRQPGAGAGHGPQGLRADRQRGHAAGHRRRGLRDARCALGLRLPDRRRGRLRRRGRWRGVGRRRGLRRVVRRALPAHRAAPRGHAGRAAAAGRCAVRTHSGRRRQHRCDPPQQRAHGRHAQRRRQMGGRTRLGHAAPTWSAWRSKARCCMPKPKYVSDQAKRAPARGDGHAGQRQPLPGSAGSHRGVRCEDCRRLRPAGRRHRGDDPLRLTRAGAPDRHRVPAPHGGRRARPRPGAAGPRTGLRADRLRPGPGIPGRHARGHQLRAGQPPDPDAAGARGVCRPAARRTAAGAVRRLAQHLQAGDAPRRRPRA